MTGFTFSFATLMKLEGIKQEHNQNDLNIVSYQSKVVNSLVFQRH